MRSLRHFLLGIASCVGLALGAAPLWAAPTQEELAQQHTDPDQIPLTVEAVEARLAQVKSAAEMDEALRAKLVETYQQVLAELKKAAEFEVKRADLMRVQSESPQLIAALQAEAAAPVPDTKVEIVPDATLAQMEQSLAEAEAAHKVAQDRASKLEQDLKEQSDRRKATPELLSAANAQLEVVRAGLTAPAPEGESREAAEARTLLLRARQHALLAEIERFETGTATYGARSELLRLRLAQAQRDAAAKSATFKSWQDAVNERRRLDAELAVQEAGRVSREKADSHSRVSREAEQNAKLAEERSAVAANLKSVSDRLVEVKAQLIEHTASYEAIAARVKAAGLEQGVGMLLKRRREALPDIRLLNREAGELRRQISATDVRLLELEDETRKYKDIDALVTASLLRLDASVTQEERDEIKAELRPLLVDQAATTEDLARDLDDYFHKLIELVEQVRRLATKVEEFTGFIDERILWIRSATVPRLADVENAKRSFLWITNGERWSRIVAATSKSVREQPAPVVAFAMLFALLVLIRRRMKRRIRELGEVASHSTTSRFMPTIEALVLTVIVSAVWPSLFMFVSWQLAHVTDAPAPAKSTAAGIQAAGWALFFLGLLRNICRPGGLGEAHFDWNPRGLRILRRHLAWFIAITLPLILFVVICELSPREESRSSLGRLAFLLRALATFVFLQRVIRPNGGIFYGTRWISQHGRFNRVKHLWYPIALGLPFCLMVLSLVGYQYTAVRLADQVKWTMTLVFVVILFNALAMRWLFVSRRRLALDQLRKRREALAQQAAERAEQTSDIDVPAEPELDVSSISEQARNLLRAAATTTMLVGLWVVWVDVLPALGILNNYELWTQKTTVMETVTSTDGTTEQKSIERRVPVRLGDLGLAIVIAAGTVIAAKNVPGLLEITILQRLPVDTGTRYAVSTVSRYLLTIVGMVTAFGRIGIGWSQVQWLAAAVTVGLGFGLQEIFANFVSGLIILFERPIRIGDIVTVGDVEGKVTRIRIRATTIMDADRREALVPNKEFITGRVRNWTLSDSITREVISVGIAYGSDVEVARRLLLKVAHDCPHVMKEPRASAIFRRFGESTLDFELRVFVEDRGEWLDLIDELHSAIDREFRKANIDIAFPQRDVHIRSITEIPVRLPPPAETVS